MKTMEENAPTTLTLWGPAGPKDTAAIAASKADGLLVELTAFRPRAITEGELLTLRRKYASCPIYGCFDGAPKNQLLYYADKHLIDGIICRGITEKARLRIRETTGQPLFLYLGALQKQDITALKHSTEDGFFFAAAPAEALLKKLNKPCIFPQDSPDTYLLYRPERTHL